MYAFVVGQWPCAHLLTNYQLPQPQAGFESPPTHPPTPPLHVCQRVAVEGCCHGELDKIYDAVRFIRDVQGVTIDLLICCGDFQSVRNEEDMECLACPPKYRAMQDFYK